MKNSRHVLVWVLGLVLVSSISQTYVGADVPVLIWGGDLAGSSEKLTNPFEKTSQVEFEKIVTRVVGGALKPVLVFVRDELCIEDLTKHKESLGQLMEGGSLIFRPAVDTPVSVFEKLPSYNCTTEEELESVSEGQLVLTNITDLDAILETFNLMKESSVKLVAALTGRSCRYSRSERIKRAAADEEPAAKSSPDIIFVNGTRILMYASASPILKFSDDGNITAVLTKNATEEGNGTKESPLQLNFDYLVKNGTTSFKANVLMRFPVKAAGYYSPEVLYKRDEKNVTLLTSTDLSFPFNFSYHCSQYVTFSNATSIKFSVADFQVQIDAKNFGDAYNCVGFTSIPIWAGIFIITILAIIMIWGLTMVMDIRTMDRFDDPKGKTITISAFPE